MVKKHDFRLRFAWDRTTSSIAHVPRDHDHGFIKRQGRLRGDYWFVEGGRVLQVTHCCPLWPCKRIDEHVMMRNARVISL